MHRAHAVSFGLCDFAIQAAIALRYGGLKEGLPNRPWYQHQIYAPGFYTGYGVKTLPGVRESIEEKQWKLAEEQIGRVGKVLENAGEAIQGAATELARGN